MDQVMMNTAFSSGSKYFWVDVEGFRRAAGIFEELDSGS
jgi:hypothetical protein